MKAPHSDAHAPGARVRREPRVAPRGRHSGAQRVRADGFNDSTVRRRAGDGAGDGADAEAREVERNGATVGDDNFFVFERRIDAPEVD